jgi:hypothetical protein
LLINKNLTITCNTILHLCKSCIITISSWSQVNESNENHYPGDDTEIDVDDWSMTSTCKTGISCYDGRLRPQICTKEKVTYSANKVQCIDKGAYMQINAGQAPTFHKLGTTFLFKFPSWSVVVDIQFIDHAPMIISLYLYS